MKKLFALMLALVTVCTVFAACGNKNTQTEPAQKSPQPTDSEKSSPSKEEGRKTLDMDNTVLYQIKAPDGTQLEWDYSSVKPAKTWEGTVWSIDAVPTDQGNIVSVIYAGDGLKDGLEARTLLENGVMTIGAISPVPGFKQGWYISDNGDGTYKFYSAGNPKFALGCKDGTFSMQYAEDASTNLTLTVVENQNLGTKYSQYVSEKGNIIVRLPADVVDQVYGRVKREYTSESEESLKGRIFDRMQMFAESVQKIYDGYIELTNFVPYKRIVIHAFDHQDVMAGVVGGDCNVYVNVDWYVDDMEKMWKRWEDGKEDFNFCVLHEMGHMFDWERGWNFESEMEADFKATYILYKYKDDKYGAWAAPAEYAWNNVWNIDTIDTGGYKGLSGNMIYGEKNGEIVYKYNIYRCAQMYTSYIKYCEETQNLKGYEAMKQTFHWFQEEGYVQNKLSGKERIELFNQKLTEFTGLDINTYMKDHFREEDWMATLARAEGLPEMK